MTLRTPLLQPTPPILAPRVTTVPTVPSPAPTTPVQQAPITPTPCSEMSPSVPHVMLANTVAPMASPLLQVSSRWHHHLPVPVHC